MTPFDDTGRAERSQHPADDDHARRRRFAAERIREGFFADRPTKPTDPIEHKHARRAALKARWEHRFDWIVERILGPYGTAERRETAWLNATYAKELRKYQRAVAAARKRGMPVPAAPPRPKTVKQRRRRYAESWLDRWIAEHPDRPLAAQYAAEIDEEQILDEQIETDPF